MQPLKSLGEVDLLVFYESGLSEPEIESLLAAVRVNHFMLDARSCRALECVGCLALS